MASDLIDYSIVIAHKNIPKLLQRCLDSIPVRTDLEIIIVDDCSDNSIVDFENFPGTERQDTIVIFDKTNKGAGHVRNIGIKQARGKWLLFADADDYFNYCIRNVLDEYVSDKSDLVFFANSSVDSETYVNNARADAHTYFLNEYFKEKSIGLNLLKYVHVAAHGKLIRKSLIIDHNIYFPEIRICEDVKFSYLSSYYAQKIKVDCRAIYCLTYRPNSLSNTINNTTILDTIRVFAEKEIFLNKHHILLPNIYHHLYLPTLINVAESENIVLYNRCLDELYRYGFNRELTDASVKTELNRKKKTQIESSRKKKAVRTHLQRLFNRIFKFDNV